MTFCVFSKNEYTFFGAIILHVLPNNLEEEVDFLGRTPWLPTKTLFSIDSNTQLRLRGKICLRLKEDMLNFFIVQILIN